MRRSYLNCPYCNKETALQGIDMHVKSRHPEKYTDYKKNYETLRTTAVVRDIQTTVKENRPAERPAVSAPALADQKRPGKGHPPRTPARPRPAPPAVPAAAAPGGEAPPPVQGEYQKSFLDELEEVTDGILKWINTP